MTLVALGAGVRTRRQPDRAGPRRAARRRVRRSRHPRRVAEQLGVGLVDRAIPAASPSGSPSRSTRPRRTTSGSRRALERLLSGGDAGAPAPLPPEHVSSDRTHETYARHFYRVAARDPSLYHLLLESTSIAIDDCVDVLTAAAHSLAAAGSLDQPAP